MIEAVSENNLTELLPLIREYQEFYNAKDISDKENRLFFAQFNEENPRGCQFILREENNVIGFATVYFSFSTVLAKKVAVLNDLYVREAFREQGAGRKLIEHCRHFAEEKGAIRLQWLTSAQNESAQHLYDSLETRKSAWYFYSYDT